ncbi:MAG: type I methionyl aminopeptidase [Cyclobacteriaceae bacterium]
MIHYKNREEIELMRESAQLASKTLGVIAKEVKPGVTPLYLDKLAEMFIRDHQAIPGFLGLYNFPNTLCTSLNEQVVHGIPNNRPLEEGDIISIDCGVIKNGFCGDQAFTFPVGNVSDEIKKLLKVTRECLALGLEKAKAGNRIGDIGFAIQYHAEKHGYGVVRELVGHGLGRAMHEDPEVPNYGKRGKGPLIKEGLVIAIEPMINLGTKKVKQLNDGWTIITQDKRVSAHYEHNMAIVDGQPDVLTTFEYIDEALEVLNV